jgi:hypothetical protein
MLITFLVAMLALIIAVLGCAALRPGYHAIVADEQETGAVDWKGSV